MKVELVSYTHSPKGLSLIEQIAYCARVSNPANQNNHETSEKLVAYLIKNKHWSPLEMVNVCLEIETTRDIARQILRHRSFTFQEFSQRYAKVENQFCTREARFQDKTNRQNSIEITGYTPIQETWESIQNDLADMAAAAYSWALDNGIAKEQARVVLPEGMTMSRLYVNGTLRSWYHYCDLRSANGTQKEHREVAIAAAEVIDTLYPGFKEMVCGT